LSEPVTKEQYEFFRALYEEEERTALKLEGRAKVFLGVISAFLAATLLKVADAKAMADTLHTPWWLLLLEALAMTVALLLVLWALRIREFEVVSDGPALLMDYGAEWPDAAQFYEDRVADYAFASSRNRAVNNEIGLLLAWGLRSMALGILFLLGIVVVAIWRA
jgi:hypothetical protein